MKKLIWLLLVAALGVAMLTGCASSGDARTKIQGAGAGAGVAGTYMPAKATPDAKKWCNVPAGAPEDSSAKVDCPNGEGELCPVKLKVSVVNGRCQVELISVMTSFNKMNKQTTIEWELVPANTNVDINEFQFDEKAGIVITKNKKWKSMDPNRKDNEPDSSTDFYNGRRDVNHVRKFSFDNKNGRVVRLCYVANVRWSGQSGVCDRTDPLIANQ